MKEKKELIPIEMTPDNLRKLGYSYDADYRSWYSEEAANSGRIDRGDGRGFVPRYQRLFFPPFGFTDRMLHDGFQLFVDENFSFSGFSFGSKS